MVRSLIIGGKGGDVSESSSLIRAGRVKYLVVFIYLFFFLSSVYCDC